MHQTLGLAGTLYYMSPEQVTGDALDARTDIWSLGVIAYQMLTNRLPFWGSNAASILEAILHATPPEIEDAPQEVRTIVNRMLSKTRGDRYQSCAELLGDLQILPIQAGGVNHKSESSGRNHAVTLDSGEPVRSLGHRHWRLLVIAALLVLAALSPPVRNGWVRAVAQSMGRLVGHGSKESTADVGRGAAPAAYETYLKGRGYLERYDKPGNLNAAIHAFETTTRTDPRFALAFAALGEAYWDKYRFDQDPQWIQQASSYCRRAAELNDKLPAVHITLGRIHDGTGEHQLALQEFQRALELDDGNADAQLGMADAYAGMGRNREAEETYKRAVAMRPENWDGQYRLGISYFHQGRFAEAASQFRRVIELTPTMRRRIRALVPRWFS